MYLLQRAQHVDVEHGLQVKRVGLHQRAPANDAGEAGHRVDAALCDQATREAAREVRGALRHVPLRERHDLAGAVDVDAAVAEAGVGARLLLVGEDPRFLLPTSALAGALSWRWSISPWPIMPSFSQISVFVRCSPKTTDLFCRRTSAS